MQHARGRYFAFLDADDRWEPSFATTLVGLRERRPEFAVVVGNALSVGGSVLDGHPVLPWPDEAREIGFVDMIELDNSVFIMSVFRREVFETIGGFNEALFRSEDYEFWMRAAAAGFRFVTHPEPLGRYHRRPGSSSSDSAAMFEAMMKVLASAWGSGTGRVPTSLERSTVNSSGCSATTCSQRASLRSSAAITRKRVPISGNGTPRRGLTHAAVSVGLRISPGLVVKAYKARLRGLERARARPANIGRGPVFAKRARCDEAPVMS
jgi:hypothetical protein